MAGKPAVVHHEGLVTLRKRGKTGIWSARYSVPGPNGKPIQKEPSLGVTNLSAAREQAREIDEALQRREYSALASREAGKDMTFAALLYQFRQDYINWSENTFEKNRGTLKKLDAEWGDLPLAAITTQMIESYLTRRRDQDGLAVATTNRYLACLKTIFKTAVRWGYLGYDPAQPLKLGKEEEKIPDALTEPELEALLEELSGDPRRIATCVADTGLRASEWRRLQWSDLDFVGLTILVRLTKSRKERMVPMTGRVRQILWDMKIENEATKTPRIQVTPIADIKKSLSAAGKRAGIGHIHMHQLRHSFATHMFDAHTPSNEVQYLLGHSDPKMTQRYDHPRPQRHRAAIDALGR